MAYTRDQYERAFAAAAARYGLDWTIGRRQINQESGFRCVTSGQGARGPAQFIPGTWARYGSGDPCNPDAAADAWARYMAHLLSVFGGDYRLALAGYHSGEGAARAALGNCAGNPRTCHYVNTIMGGVSTPSPVTPQATGASGGSAQSFPTIKGLSLTLPLIVVGAIVFFVILRD